jgi:hypothetical protein
MQLMFVLAFLINAIAVFWVARKWQASQIGPGGVFLLFWFVDAFVPWLYQILVFGSSFIPFIVVLGFFPAMIIVLSIRMNYSSPAIQEGRSK